MNTLCPVASYQPCGKLRKSVLSSWLDSERSLCPFAMVSTDKEKPALLRVFFFSELAFVLPPQVGGFARQGDFDAQAGFVIVQLQAAVVQGDDGAHQRQSQAVAGGAARAVQADEAF